MIAEVKTRNTRNTPAVRGVLQRIEVPLEVHGPFRTARARQGCTNLHSEVKAQDQNCTGLLSEVHGPLFRTTRAHQNYTGLFSEVKEHGTRVRSETTRLEVHKLDIRRVKAAH